LLQKKVSGNWLALTQKLEKPKAINPLRGELTFPLRPVVDAEGFNRIRQFMLASNAETPYALTAQG
jgi:hypothetical protein